MDVKYVVENKKNVTKRSKILHERHYLLIICISYIGCAANEFWVVNWFKEYGVNLPIYFAMLQNGSWPFQLYIYRKECSELPEPRIWNQETYKSYCILGCLAAFIGLSRMYSLSILPPVLTVICSNTEIVFETLMTIFILKKSVSWYQYSAVVLVLLGVVIALYDPKSQSFGGGESSDGNSSITQKELFTGVGLSLVSRFASSLNTVLAEKFLGKGAKSKIGVKECALVNSIVPFVLLPFALPLTGEYKRWSRELYRPHAAVGITAIIALLSIVLCESKHIDRFSKYAIVEHTSTLFFAGVDSAMKMLAGIMSFVFFTSDPAQIEWPTLVGFAIVSIAVMLLYLDKRHKSLQAAQQAMDYHVVKLLDCEHSAMEDGETTSLTESDDCPACVVNAVHKVSSNDRLSAIHRVKSGASIVSLN